MAKQKKNSAKSKDKTKTKTKTEPIAEADFKRLADFLQQQRRNRRISIRKISQITNLPETTVRALENPNKSNLPKSNVLGLYRVYGSALGVSARRIRDLGGGGTDIQPEFSIKRLPKLKSLVVFSNITTTVIVSSILIVVLGYSAWAGYGLVSAPSISIEYPDQEFVVVDESSFEVRGSAPVESTVLVNGEPTTVNADSGQFSQLVYLQSGYNYVTVEVVNGFSSSATENFVVIYNPPKTTAVY